LGVDTIFGLIGDANLFFCDDFQRECGGRFVSVAHEASAVLAANGYAHTTGRVGGATVTHGPGLTNTLTPLVEAARDRAAVVLIAGDTRDAAHLQCIDQAAVVTPTGAGFEEVSSAAALTDGVTTAFQRAVSERRPIVLSVPVDLQWQEIEYTAPVRPT